MIGRSAGVIAASLALAANAFLLPPNMPPVIDSTSDSVSPELFLDLLDPSSWLLSLPCSACVFPSTEGNVAESEEGDDLFWIQGGANNILLNFTVSEDKHSLQMNGVAIYPVSVGKWSWADLYVDQVSQAASLSDVADGKVSRTPLLVTASGFTTGVEQTLSDLGDTVVPLTVKIMSLEGHEMINLAATIKLLKSADGELMIMNAGAAKDSETMFDAPHYPPLPGPRPAGEHGRMKDCGMLPAPICKFKHMLEDKIHGKIHNGGCGKDSKGVSTTHHLPTNIKPHNRHGPPPKGRKPHRFHPHGPHGHHKHHRHMLRAILKGFVAVLIPIMTGVAVGVTVSLLGLVVGRLIGHLWQKSHRGGKRGYASVAQDEIIMIEEGGEKILAADEDAESPPVYEDAPAYEEAAKVQE